MTASNPASKEAFTFHRDPLLEVTNAEAIKFRASQKEESLENKKIPTQTNRKHVKRCLNPQEASLSVNFGQAKKTRNKLEESANNDDELAMPLTPHILNVEVDAVDLPDQSDNTPSVTPRYGFRKRTLKFVQEYDFSSDEENLFDDGDDSFDNKWALSDFTFDTASKKKKGVVELESSDSENGSDNESVLGGFVTLPKSTCPRSERKPKNLSSNNRQPCSKKKLINDSCSSQKNADKLVEEDEGSVDDIDFDWFAGDLPETNRPPVEIPPPDTVLWEPIDYFEYFFDETIIRLMTDFTNSYSTWKSAGTRCISVSESEMKHFLGIWLYMGVVKLPALRDYWHTDTRIPQVADIMTFNRFQSIRAALHFYNKADEDSLDTTDRFRKVSLLMEHIRKKCNDLPQESRFSIDETMIPYKGTFAGNLRHYIKDKPHKFGFKLFSLAGVSGIIYDFIPYSGAETFRNVTFNEEESKLGVGGKIVIHLTRSIDRPELSTICFDNYFSSVSLFMYLKEKRNLLATETIRSNRIDKCPLQSDKQLTKEGRGAHDTKLKGCVQVIKWNDNKVVHVASTSAGVEPVGKAKRYDKSSKGKMQVPIPRAIEFYNENMGCVDLSDMLVELHRVPTKARCWYIPIVGYMLDLSVVNSWLLYRRHAMSLGMKAPLKSKGFRLSICKTLMGGTSSLQNVPKVKKVIKTPRTFRPEDAVRKDGIGHWAHYGDVQKRCKHCSNGQTKVLCSKCNVPLCLVPTRNCFYSFHTS